jgi:hypothetical protein
VFDPVFTTTAEASFDSGTRVGKVAAWQL